MAELIVHCYYIGEEDAVCGFIEEMIDSGLQKEIREEDGCLQYDYFFSAEDKGKGALLERWRDETALSKHMNGSPMQRLQEVKARYAIETRVERYTLKE